MRDGREKAVTIDVGGRGMRGTLVAADEEGVTVRARGMEMQVPWSTLPPRRFYGIAKQYTDDHAALAQYCRGRGLLKEAAMENER